jgi:ubiquitin
MGLVVFVDGNTIFSVRCEMDEQKTTGYWKKPKQRCAKCHLNRAKIAKHIECTPEKKAARDYRNFQFVISRAFPEKGRYPPRAGQSKCRTLKHELDFTHFPPWFSPVIAQWPEPKHNSMANNAASAYWA